MPRHAHSGRRERVFLAPGCSHDGSWMPRPLQKGWGAGTRNPRTETPRKGRGRGKRIFPANTERWVRCLGNSYQSADGGRRRSTSAAGDSALRNPVICGPTHSTQIRRRGLRRICSHPMRKPVESKTRTHNGRVGSYRLTRKRRCCLCRWGRASCRSR